MKTSLQQSALSSQPPALSLDEQVVYHGVRSEGLAEVWVYFGEVIEKKLPLGASLKLVNHSPSGFEWGYGGSGPAQLALALCLDVLDDRQRALAVYQQFKWKYLAGWPFDGWVHSRAELRRMIEAAEADRSAAVRA